MDLSLATRDYTVQFIIPREFFCVKVLVMNIIYQVNREIKRFSFFEDYIPILTNIYIITAKEL